ncbi:MAG TPA: fused MFS/spermidine synthase [Anaerolineae bacterium]|nr:fused MFS/spermidine synthase [Anaerolineae bacterium]
MRPIVAGLIVFGASAAVLTLEILAVRLLAPYLGITVEVTTGVIGTVLAGIALGTWLGGRLADAVDPRRLLGPILFVGGVLALSVIPMISLVANADVGPGPQGILIYAGTAFFLPAAVLSAAGPTVVKLQLEHLEQTGSIVGRYSAIGTAGAIVGSFVTGFVLVSAIPTRPIIVALGLALMAAGVVVAAVLGRSRPSALAALALMVAGGAVLWTIVSPQPCQRESAYFCISVEIISADGSERLLRMDTLRHAYVDLDDPTHLEFAYTGLLGDVADAIAPPSVPIAVLHLGGGGFTLPRYVEATRPSSTNRVLELDPLVLQVAREELGLAMWDGLSVVVGDGRLSMGDEPSGRYDLVIGDAFAGPAVPWHLTTTEFVAEVGRVLTPRGIYAINIIDHPPLELARAQLATFAEVFGHVGVYGPASRVEGASGGNVILLGSNQPLPERPILRMNRARGGDAHLAASETEIAAFIDGAPVLRDDFAPTDQLLTRFEVTAAAPLLP